MAYLEAIKTVLGKEKFDTLFDAESVSPLVLNYSAGNPLFALLSCQPTETALDNLKPAQMVHFRGGKNYQIKHPFIGVGAGYNAFCRDVTPGKKKFTGFGLSPQGVTINEIAQELMKEFNKPPIPLSEIASGDLKRRTEKLFLEGDRAILTKHLSTKTYSSVKDFNADGGGFAARVVWDFNVERIMLLKESSMEESRKLFTKWVTAEGHVAKSKTEVHKISVSV